MQPCFVDLKELPTNGSFFQHAMIELMHAEFSINIDYHGEKQQSFKSFLEVHLTVVYSPTSSHKETSVAWKMHSQPSVISMKLQYSLHVGVHIFGRVRCLPLFQRSGV